MTQPAPVTPNDPENSEWLLKWSESGYYLATADGAEIIDRKEHPSADLFGLPQTFLEYIAQLHNASLKAAAPPPEGAGLSDKALLMLLLELESATMRMHDPSTKMRDIAVKSAQEAREKIIAHDAALRKQVQQWQTEAGIQESCRGDWQEECGELQAQLTRAETERAALLHTASLLWSDLKEWDAASRRVLLEHRATLDPLLAQGLALLGGEG